MRLDQSTSTPKESSPARDPAPRHREVSVAIGLASFAWLACVLAFREGDGVLLVGTAVVCALSGIAMHRRGLPSGLFMLLAALPWMVMQEHRLAAAMARDLKEHHWTAYAFDGVLGSAIISAKGLVFCMAAWVIARVVSSMVPVQKNGRPDPG